MMLFRVLVASGVAVEQLESLRVGHGIGILETLMIGVELCVGVQTSDTATGQMRILR
jgi:tetrahydromethanopterin S-methyltransferase subunit G